MGRKQMRMTEGTPWKQVILFSLPVLAGALLQQLYNTADAIIVGQFSGESALAAVGTTGSFVFLFLAVAMGISAGNGVVVAQHYGAGDSAEVRANAAAGIFFQSALGLIAAAVGAAVAEPAFERLVDTPPEFLDLTVRYFQIYAIGLFFQFGYNAFSSILRGVGDSAATLYFLLISSVANILLDLLFVAGLHWGVVGAAVATDLAQLISFVAAYVYMTRKYPIFRFRFSEFRWDARRSLQTVRIGFPISLQLMVVAFGFTLIQRAVNGFGQVMTAACTVGQRVEMYVGLPCHAFLTTVATFAGQNIGAGLIDRAKRGMKQTVLVSVLMTLAISVLTWLFDDQIVSLFGVSDAARGYALSYIHAVSITNLLIAAYLPVFGFFQAANHSAFPMIVAICALSMRVGSVYLFRHSPFLGHSVVWWNSAFGYVTGSTITWSLYFSGLWKRNARLTKGTSKGEPASLEALNSDAPKDVAATGPDAGE